MAGHRMTVWPHVHVVGVQRADGVCLSQQHTHTLQERRKGGTSLSFRRAGRMATRQHMPLLWRCHEEVVVVTPFSSKRHRLLQAGHTTPWWSSHPPFLPLCLHPALVSARPVKALSTPPRLLRGQPSCVGCTLAPAVQPSATPGWKLCVIPCLPALSPLLPVPPHLLCGERRHAEVVPSIQQQSHGSPHAGQHVRDWPPPLPSPASHPAPSHVPSPALSPVPSCVGCTCPPAAEPWVAPGCTACA